MGVAEWPDTYGIHHWRILWGSYRKLAWVGFEPMATKLRSNALTNWAIRPRVQLALRANFLQLLQFHQFIQCRISFRHFPSSVATFILIEYIYIYIYIYIYNVSGSWTHGLIAQSVRASERNSVDVSSSPRQASFL